MEQLVERVIRGDKRSAARAISIIENNATEKKQLLKLLHPFTGKAKVIGVTGPPGAGKSTLVDGLINEIRSAGFKVGVVAIDPSSPFSGGAILGDRIRMQRHTLDAGVFIRSMGNRCYLGGLAKATQETVSVIDAMGMDYIIIETVGVGQSELEIINTSDTTIVILTPNSGDVIQIHKAGIMEIADVYVVNKMDLSGAQKTVNELETFIKENYQDSQWKPPVIKTIAAEHLGVNILWQKVNEHIDYLLEAELFSKNRSKKLDRYVTSSIQSMFNKKIESFFAAENNRSVINQLMTEGKSPLEIAEIIFKKIDEY